MAGKWAIWALALLAGSAAVISQGQAANAAIALSNEEQIWLDTHNTARARYGRAPLIWDEGLARDARLWARHLARTQSFEHSSDDNGQGENLWMGTRGAFPSAHMVQNWVDEDRYFKSGTFPNVSTTGNWADVGHATQLLWPSTTHVGCAKASSASDDYMVCRYAPPGNWIGEFFDGKEK